MQISKVCIDLFMESMKDEYQAIVLVASLEESGLKEPSTFALCSEILRVLVEPRSSRHNSLSFESNGG